MKRISVVIIFMLIVISSFAQRVNGYGLKMVSEIEYADDNDRGGVYLLKFGYDNNDRLNRMSIYRKSARLDNDSYKLYRDYKRTATGLTQKNYDEEEWVEYSFDIHGNLSQILVFEEFEFGGMKKDEYNCFYVKDSSTGRYRLNGYDWDTSRKGKGEKSWESMTFCTTPVTIYYKDGFLTGNEGHLDNIDYGHINDTNMDLHSFFEDANKIFNHGLLSFLSVTEWMNCRSKYMERGGGNGKYEYQYDNKGNLILIKAFVRGRQTWYVKIKYLY